MSGYYADVAAAQADGVLHHWAFDETSGTVCSDDVGTMAINVDTTDFTGPDPDVSIVDGLYGKGRDPFAYGSSVLQDILPLKFDAASQVTATTLSSWSFRLRFYFRSNLFDDVNLVYLGRAGYLYQNLNLWMGSGGNVVECYTKNVSITNAPALTANSWNEIIVTSDGSTVSMYQNGSLVGTGADTEVWPIYYGSADYLGSQWPSGTTSNWEHTLNGIIDECSIWNRALTAQEVTTLYNSGSFTSLFAAPEPPAPPIPTMNSNQGIAAYKAILTGAPDSTTDLDLKMSSFNARLRSARDSYLSIVVPHAASFIDEIEARPNGEIVLMQSLEGIDTELARVNFDDMRTDKGSRSGTTATLSGNKQKTYSNPDSHAVNFAEYYNRSAGKSRARFQLVQGVEPADTIEIEGASFVIDTVTLIGATNRIYMEVSE